MPIITILVTIIIITIRDLSLFVISHLCLMFDGSSPNSGHAPALAARLLRATSSHADAFVFKGRHSLGSLLACRDASLSQCLTVSPN
jgi:hypothetical protein